MENITEKKYSIQTAWIFKVLFYHLSIILLIAIVMYFSNSIKLNSSAVLVLITVFLLYEFGLIAGNFTRRKNFYFSFDEQTASFHQGKAISLLKLRRDLEISYKQIQNIYVNCQIFEKLFSLESLTIKFIVKDGIQDGWLNNQGYRGRRTSRMEWLGFVGDKIHIPGLKKEEAEKLREFLSHKMSSF